MKNILSICFMLMAVVLHAQQLESIGIKKGVKINGGVSLANNFYTASGISNRLNPYSYVLSGNLNINAFGVSIPLSFAYSNQNFSYRQPFNIVGASPSYKKFKAHIGYRNLTFSPYTLSGHNFLGGGLEYNGDKFSVVVMSGRLLKAVDYDSNNVNALPAYKRMGAGIKLSYRNKGDQISISNFYAKDIINSIDSVPARVGLQAQENVVWGVSFKKALGKKFALTGELARSAWTKDITAQEVPNQSKGPLDAIFYIRGNQSTVTYNAMKFNGTYTFKLFSLGAGYERIDPEYRTLGAYYFNNDLENITMNAATAFMKNKIKVSGNVGLQRDDLNKQKSSSMKRTVGSVSLGMTPTARLNINLSYSNFYSYVNIKPIDLQYLPNARYDTLNYTQISQTISGSVGYTLLQSDKVTKMIQLSGSQMGATSKQASTNRTNTMLNATVAYNQAWKESGISLGVSANGNQSRFEDNTNLYVGLGIMGGAPLFKKKLRTSLGLNMNQNYDNNTLVAYLFSVNNGYSYRLGKHQSLNASLRYTGRTKIANAVTGRYNTSFNEFMGSLSYSYSF
ncbi:hypothetical protein [Cytophaga aurantiaca]|uniref:hypothetical protein n=1 Tax=Cytophaga aurantiaca TaxID=29530 RepID=UPI000475D541|nr:hypothetical protein [Cytophaga aurantiaca]